MGKREEEVTISSFRDRIDFLKKKNLTAGDVILQRSRIEDP